MQVFEIKTMTYVDREITKFPFSQLSTVQIFAQYKYLSSKKYDKNTTAICFVHLKESFPDLLLCVSTIQDVGIKLKKKLYFICFQRKTIENLKKKINVSYLPKEVV